MEKLKIQELTCCELVKQAAKIIYVVHDKVKDKQFELELSSVGKETGGKYKMLPKELFDEAETYAKQSLEESESSDSDQET